MREESVSDELYVALLEVLMPDKLGDWLKMHNQTFEGRTPLQVIADGDEHRIWAMIHELRSECSY